MKAMDLNIGTIHFVGIGGIGMSGIAEVLNTLGYTVQGSDINDSANVKRLRDQGIDVKIGHDAAYVKDVACVVISSAVIKGDNPELSAARAAKIPVVRRAEMLAELMRMKFAIGIGGTHGKTTTTAMVGQMLEAAGLDPTVINGGIVNAYGTNVRLGNSEWMVVESDESDGTFTKLPASAVVVTNIDPEHMEHYGSFEALKDAFKTFITNIPFYGYAVLCIDHPEVQALIPEITDRKIITYGFSPQADIRAENLRTDPSGTTFDVSFAQSGLELKDIFLPMLGRHNVQNSLVALAIANQMEIAPPLMKKGMESFTGVKRRFTKTGEVNGVTIIDDYAHHPVEIATILETARTAVKDTGGNVIAVMQPHRYSRLHDLFEEFSTCFNEADTVILTDIYEAGETPIEGATKEALAEGIKKHGHKDVTILTAREDLAKILHGKVKQGDFIICMGAGDITAWAYDLPGELEKLSQSNAA